MSSDNLGITGADREKLAQLASSEPDGNDNSIPPFESSIVQAVREWIDNSEYNYVDSGQISRDLSYDKRQIGRALARLEREGELKRWSAKNTRPQKWKVESR